jgi:serine/threonine protein phosphatase PrpC
MSKTQPSPAYRKDGPKTAPVITVAEPITLPAAGRRPGQITWQIAGLTDTGFKRELNEDNLTLLEAEMNDDRPYGVYLVADGMGGHQGGDVASQVTVEAVQEFFKQQPISPVIPYQDWLKDATMAANQAVLDRQEDHTQERKMGSTLVVALVTAGQAHIANVGDSRAYHLNDESIQQVSVDHSLVERLVQLGQLTREEARTHKQRNVIYNTIGDKSDPEISLNHVFLKPGDRLLLCSDGLSSMLPDDEILAISRQQADPAAACRELVRAAKAAGGDDNITAIVVQMDAA